MAELFEKAGPLAWLLVPISVAGLSLVGERLLFWTGYLLSARLRRGLTERARRGALDERDLALLERVRDPVPHLLHRLRLARGRRELVSSGIARETERAAAGVGALATLAELSPTVGLLGTVWGVAQLLPAYRASDMGGVVDGLSTALYTTLGGLVLFLAFSPAAFLFSTGAERLRLRLESEAEAAARRAEGGR